MSYFSVGQVAPYQIPNDIDDSSVWQKTYSFESDKRVVVKFDLDDCFNDKDSFSYVSISVNRSSNEGNLPINTSDLVGSKL